MDANRPSDHLAEMTAALDWWRDAGVDHAFVDAPRLWIVAKDTEDQDAAAGDPNSFPAVTAPIVAAPPPPAMIGGDRAGWPSELTGFAEWWLSEPSLDFGQVRGRVPPRGPAGAALMVIVPEPEAGDEEVLLSGPQGRLLSAMLSAMRLGPEQVYFASALPRHTPMADWSGLAAQGLGEVLWHHVRLVEPRRLIAFGRHISALLTPLGLGPTLTDNDPAQNAENLPTSNHDKGSVELLVARDLGSLLERPIAKGAFWQQWLEWSSGRQAESA